MQTYRVLLLKARRIFRMTKGYITSLSRSPWDQYTWLSSLTEFSPNARAKGWPGAKPETLDALERDAYLLIVLTTPSPFSPQRRHPPTPPPPPYRLPAKNVRSTGLVCSRGLLFIFMCVGGFFALVKSKARVPEWYLWI